MATALLQPIDHLTYTELTQRFRTCKDGRQKTRWQALWLMSRPDQPYSASQAAALVGLTADVVRKLVRRSLTVGFGLGFTIGEIHDTKTGQSWKYWEIGAATPGVSVSGSISDSAPTEGVSQVLSGTLAPVAVGATGSLAHDDQGFHPGLAATAGFRPAGVSFIGVMTSSGSWFDSPAPSVPGGVTQPGDSQSTGSGTPSTLPGSGGFLRGDRYPHYDWIGFTDGYYLYYNVARGMSFSGNINYYHYLYHQPYPWPIAPPPGDPFWLHFDNDGKGYDLSTTPGTMPRATDWVLEGASSNIQFSNDGSFQVTYADPSLTNSSLVAHQLSNPNWRVFVSIGFGLFSQDQYFLQFIPEDQPGYQPQTDFVGPDSAVDPLPQFNTGAFNISWSGTDNPGGSGIKGYDIYYSDNGSAFARYWSQTTATSMRYYGQDGHTYRFYSIAWDDAGNRQAGAIQIRSTLVDMADPTSHVAGLPASSPGRFTVSWSGSDGNGSGIAGYDVYVSDNGGASTLWQSNTTQNSASFVGAQDGHTYRFYSIATDRVGHRQATPASAQATTTVKADAADGLAALRRLYGFEPTGNYYQDYGDLNAKWFKDREGTASAHKWVI